ncbi:MAG: phosphoribosylanthranilate isomerase [Saprospiraceae bacterium]
MKMSPRIKICCIASVAEAKVAINHGANAIGLLGPMPSGSGPIEIALIKKIAVAVPPGVSTFLLTCETTAKGIIGIYEKTYVQVLQLVDEVEDMEVYTKVRKAIPHIKLVQVIHVIGPESLSEALIKAPYVDALLLDSGNPKLAVKELGGTGRVHDWSVSKAIVDETDIPIFLAGGLNPENVKEAIEKVRPYGVDVCSGLRRDGRLDENLLIKFVNAVSQG